MHLSTVSPLKLGFGWQRSLNLLVDDDLSGGETCRRLLQVMNKLLSLAEVCLVSGSPQHPDNEWILELEESEWCNGTQAAHR